MMRLTRILIFPYFSLSITDQLPPTVYRWIYAALRTEILEARAMIVAAGMVSAKRLVDHA